MPLNFPTGLFGFLDQEVDIERQTLRGGRAISGEEDIVSTDGGGRVFAEFSAGNLIDREKVLAWRALLANLEEGVTAVVVPFCDRRHQPYGTPRRVNHSDGTPFDDGAPYRSGDGSAGTRFAATQRATSLTLSMFLPQPVIGGEWFTIDHPNKGVRAYKVKSIEGEVVRFVPPLREAVPENTPVDFNDPRCLMVQDGRASSLLVGKRNTPAAIRFVEAP